MKSSILHEVEHKTTHIQLDGWFSVNEELVFNYKGELRKIKNTLKKEINERYRNSKFLLCIDSRDTIKGVTKAFMTISVYFYEIINLEKGQIIVNELINIIKTQTNFKFN